MQQSIELHCHHLPVMNAKKGDAALSATSKDRRSKYIYDNLDLFALSFFSFFFSTTCLLGHEAMTQRKTNHDRLHIPNVVLIPFALVQSQVFWVCSVIWTLCMQWSTEEHQAPPTFTTKDDDTKVTLPQDARVEQLRRLGRQTRPRGNSEPPTPTTTSMAELVDSSDGARRARCTTISFPPSRRQRLLQTRRQLEGIEIRPSREDEKAGATCPPQWWQKTRFYIDALKHQQQPAASSSTSTLPTLPSSTSTHSSPDASPIIVSSPPAMSQDIQQQQQQLEGESLASQQQQQSSSSTTTLPESTSSHVNEKKTRRRATILGLLHHQHRSSSSKEQVNTRDTKNNKKSQRRARSFFWKKKSSINASS